MAKSVGFGVVEFASEYQPSEAELILVIGDLQSPAATIAAAFMNLCIVHLQGEVSGSIEQHSARDHQARPTSTYRAPGDRPNTS